MHIHGHTINSAAAAVHSAAAAEKAASASRASETRRKLLENASALDGFDAGLGFRSLLVGQWPEERAGRQPQEAETATKEYENAENMPSPQTVSVWA